MRLLIWAAAVCAAALLPAAAADPAGGRAVRVLSYNIHHGEGLDGRIDLARIAGVIRAAKPDIVALQEVDRKTRRCGGVDQPAKLGELTGMHVYFGKAIDYDGGEYGQVLLSPHPLSATATHRLPNAQGLEQRVVLTARVRLGQGGPELTAAGTHLDHRSADIRRRQAEAINKLAASWTGPAVLAGDLNARPDGPPLRTLLESWRNATAAAGLLTMPAEQPRSQIDYVLVRPAQRWRAAEARVIDERVASDHRPILAVVELLPE